MPYLPKTMSHPLHSTNDRTCSLGGVIYGSDFRIKFELELTLDVLLFFVLIS